MDTFTYDAQEQDFARGLASDLDGWVFERVSKFLKTAAGHPVTAARLRQQGTVLFLHLLGLDTTGHGHKPQSRWGEWGVGGGRGLVERSGGMLAICTL